MFRIFSRIKNWLQEKWYGKSQPSIAVAASPLIIQKTPYAKVSIDQTLFIADLPDELIAKILDHSVDAAYTEKYGLDVIPYQFKLIEYRTVCRRWKYIVNNHCSSLVGLETRLNELQLTTSENEKRIRGFVRMYESTIASDIAHSFVKSKNQDKPPADKKIVDRTIIKLFRQGKSFDEALKFLEVHYKKRNFLLRVADTLISLGSFIFTCFKGYEEGAFVLNAMNVIALYIFWPYSEITEREISATIADKIIQEISGNRCPYDTKAGYEVCGAEGVELLIANKVITEEKYNVLFNKFLQTAPTEIANNYWTVFAIAVGILAVRGALLLGGCYVKRKANQLQFFSPIQCDPPMKEVITINNPSLENVNLNRLRF